MSDPEQPISEHGQPLTPPRAGPEPFPEPQPEPPTHRTRERRSPSRYTVPLLYGVAAVAIVAGVLVAAGFIGVTL